MFLKNRFDRFMSKVSAYDSWGGGGYSDDDNGRVSDNYSSGGSGRDGGPGYGNLGLGVGPYSSIDETGAFTGVVDDSLGFGGRAWENFKTNISKALSGMTGLQKTGLAATILKNPLVAPVGIAYLTGKSLMQALSTPGLTEDQKQTITETWNKIDSLPPEDKAQVLGEFKALGDANSNNTNDAIIPNLGATTTPATTTTTTGGTEKTATPSFWETYQKEFFGDESNGAALLRDLSENILGKDVFKQNKSAEDLLKDHADFIAGEADKQNTTLTGATDKQNTLLDRLTGEAQADTTVSDANKKLQATLDQLMGESNYNTGRFKPIMYTAGGNTISKVPNSALKEIEAVRGIGQDGFDAAGLTAQQAAKLRAEQGAYGQTGFDNTTGTAKSIFENAGVRSPSVGKLSYLDALQGNITTEEQKRQFDDLMKYRRDALDKGIAVDNRQLDQKEPGLWSYLGVASDTANSFGNLLKDWF